MEANSNRDFNGDKNCTEILESNKDMSTMNVFRHVYYALSNKGFHGHAQRQYV
jgi:hypothetical protein